MISAAVSPALSSVTLLPATIEPPADCTSELNQTTAPSYCAPWISIRPAFGSLEAWLIRPFQVLAGSRTRSLRYHSSCVFVFAGAAHSRPSTVAVLSGPASVPRRTGAAKRSGHGRIQPADANSAVHTTSIPAMSMLESLAASRRTSESRCWSASLDSALNTIRYRPPDCSLQRLAASVNDPDGSWKTHRFSVAGPPEDPDPQPATTSPVTTSAIAPSAARGPKDGVERRMRPACSALAPRLSSFS